MFAQKLADFSLNKADYEQLYVRTKTLANVAQQWSKKATHENTAQHLYIGYSYSGTQYPEQSQTVTPN